MAKSKILYERIYTKIEQTMSNNKNVMEVQKIFTEMVNANNEPLSAAIPNKAVFVPLKLENKLFKVFNIEKKEILEAMKDSPDINYEKWNTVRNPVYVLLMLLVIYCNNNKKEALMKQSMFILSMYMYRNIRSKYFSVVSESTVRAMNYTLGRLSYKNDLKKYGSILKMINKKNEVFITNWFVERKKDATGEVTDTIICKMIADNHRRYSTAINIFYGELKKDLMEGNYLNVDQDIDDGDTFIQSDNVSFMVEKAAQKIIGKLSLSTYPDALIIKHTCALEPGCSINNLRTIVGYMYNKGEEDFEECIRILTQVYLFDYKKRPEDMKTPDFILDMKTYYKKQTEKDVNLINLKNYIDNFIIKSGISKRITRNATLNDCKRATLVYILLFMQRNI